MSVGSTVSPPPTAYSAANWHTWHTRGHYIYECFGHNQLWTVREEFGTRPKNKSYIYIYIYIYIMSINYFCLVRLFSICGLNSQRDWLVESASSGAKFLLNIHLNASNIYFEFYRKSVDIYGDFCAHLIQVSTSAVAGTFAEVKARRSRYSTWMLGDHQGRLGAVILGPFVGVDLNLWPTVYSRYRADTDVERIKPNQACPLDLPVRTRVRMFPSKKERDIFSRSLVISKKNSALLMFEKYEILQNEWLPFYQTFETASVFDNRLRINDSCWRVCVYVYAVPLCDIALLWILVLAGVLYRGHDFELVRIIHDILHFNIHVHLHVHLHFVWWWPQNNVVNFRFYFICESQTERERERDFWASERENWVKSPCRSIIHSNSFNDVFRAIRWRMHSSHTVIIIV